MNRLTGVALTALWATVVAASASESALWRPDATTVLAFDGDDRVMRTAVADLRRVAAGLFPGVALPADSEAAPGAIVLGTGYGNPRIREWMRAGLLEIRDVPRSREAYEIRFVEGRLVVAGSTPGSVLDGVYRLEEALKEHGGLPRAFHEVSHPHFEWRIMHPSSPAGRSFHEYRAEDFAWIRRCGGNTALMMHDWMGEKYLHSFGRSEVFPDEIDAATRDRNRASLRRHIAHALDHGLRVALWICEMPCQGGPWMSDAAREAFLSRYPAEVLSDSGTYQGQVLCLAHPLVEEHYRQLLRTLLMDFPEVTLIQLFTLDSNAEFCSPETCPRHAGVPKIAQRDRIITLMLDEGRKVRPQLRVLTTTWAWQSHEGFLERQAALPPGSGLFSTPDAEAWSFDRKYTDALVRQRDICRDTGQLFLGYDIFLWGDDVLCPPHRRIYDYPYGVAAKLRRWARVGADGVFDQWGAEPELLANNALALRRFWFDPFQDPEPVVGEIARRQYGDAADAVLAAWRAIETAQRAQSDHTFYWHALRHNWSDRVFDKTLTVETLAALDVIPSSEPAKPAGPIDHAPPGEAARAERLGRASRDIVSALTEAERRFREALDRTPADARSWYAGLVSEMPVVSPREQLELQLRTVRIVAGMQRELGHFFEAYALAHAVSAAQGSERDALQARFDALLRETLEGTRDLRALLVETGATDATMLRLLDERERDLETRLDRP